MPEHAAPESGDRRSSGNARTAVWISALLVVLTVAAFWRVGDCGFVSYDDYGYVVNNPMVNQGLRSAAACWAFTSSHSSNWHPLTSLSHIVDCSRFGLNPAPPHWENLALHALDVVLVFLAWRRVSGTAWPPALVAALFALHPLRVESVAWISERKDVLSTAMWLVTIFAYIGYAARPSLARYGAVMFGLALGLMAKPMVVTLPVTLLLLDFWPLKRWQSLGWWKLVAEKLPLFALVVASCVITLVVQRASGAMDSGLQFSFGMRLGNATVSIVRYLGKAIWPADLSPFYPHPGSWPLWVVTGAVLVIVVVSWVAWKERERRPWILFGWGWYVVTLGPVLGIVQVGAQSIADRYTYVPLLGIFTIVAWGAAEIVSKWPRLKALIAACALAVLAGCFIQTRTQTAIWEDGLKLTERMRAIAGEHPIVLRETAAALTIAGRSEEEVTAVYRRGADLAPDYPYFQTQLAISAAQAGRLDEARALIEKLIERHLRHALGYDNLGTLALLQGRYDDAVRYSRKAIEISPEMTSAHWLLARALREQGRLVDARDALREAIRLNRWDANTQNELGEVYAQLGESGDALECFERAVWIHPGHDAARQNMNLLRQRLSLPIGAR